MKSAMVIPFLWIACMACFLSGKAGATLIEVLPDSPSTEIHADDSVTFRFRDPTAKKVELILEDHADRLPMNKDHSGMWVVTTPPLKPEIYGYRFMVDDDPETRHDPQNPAVRYGNNLITVPGKTPKPWEISAVPHGAVAWHTYRTKIVLGLPGNRSSYLVYTPPGYDSRKTVRYPVLYLLHCWGDRPDSWNKFDQASIIFDNLLAAKKMKPMIVVMPLGYGDMQFSKKYLWDQPAAVLHNLNLFSEAFLKEVMPNVERQYSISANREDRAIIGASMGGLESLTIGLNHTDKFAWIGGISSAVDNLDFIQHFSSFHAATADLSLLWIACGTGDDLITSNQRLISWISKQQVPVTTANGPGLHSYIFWRESLIRFAMLLFQDK